MPLLGLYKTFEYKDFSNSWITLNKLGVMWWTQTISSERLITTYTSQAMSHRIFMPSECIKDRNMVRFIQAEVKLVWVINISG